MQAETGISGVSSIPLMPIERMWRRIAIAKAESDTAYFHDLTYFGEMLAKLIVAAVLATVEDDRERLRYRHAYSLVRASGLGDWATTLEEILIGPSSAQHLAPEVQECLRALTQKQGPGAWQHDAVRLLIEALTILDPQTSQMSGKVDGKRWVTLMARVRNKRSHGALPGAPCSRLCPLLEESIRLVAEGIPFFNKEWAYLHRNLSGKYRVTVLGGNGNPFSHLKSTAEECIPNGVYVDIGRIRRVELVDSDVDAADFSIANGAFREKRYEMLSYITGSTHHVDGSQYIEPIGPLPGSETAGIRKLDTIGETWTNLPKQSDSYIPRLALEGELLRTLKGDRYPVVTLVGRGGIGKTSLALTTLHDLAREKQFDLMLWFSARDLDLLSAGPKRVQPAVLSMKDMADELVRLVEPSEALQKGFSAEAYLSRVLSSSPFGPTLFVFDNFETVASPIELYRWLDNNIRLPNKILITTRQREFRGDYPIDVRGMNEAEFIQLVERTSVRLGIQGLLTQAYREELFKESEGHPYVVKILLGEVAKAGKLRDVERIVADQSEILTALFERTFATLSPAAQRVFLTLSRWRSTLPRLAIVAVLLRQENERIPVEDAIDELERSSFIELTTSEADGQVFITTPLAAALFGKRKAAVSPMKAAIEADLELLKWFGAGQREDVRQGVEPRISRLIRSIAKRIEEGKDPLSRYITMLEFIGRHYGPAWLLLADLYEESHESDGLRKATEAVRQYLADAKKPEERNRGWRRIADLARRTADAPGEIHSLVEIAELPGASLEETSNAANRVNQLLKDNRSALETDEKRILVRKLAESLQKLLSEADATDFSRLAWLEIHLGDDRAAYEFAQKGLERDPENEHCLNLQARLAPKYGRDRV